MRTLSKIIAEQVNYFIDHPDKRCVSIYGECGYSGKSLNLDTTGCLVGRMLSKKDRELADKLDVGGVSGLVKEDRLSSIPKYIKKNASAMRDFQALHDNSFHWDEDGMSGGGLIRIEELIERHNLDRSDFNI